MAEAPAKKPAVPKAVQIGGGAVFLAASLALMIHRVPHREYAAPHADKPRPSPSGEAPAAPAPAPAPKAAPAAPAPVAKAAPAAAVPFKAAAAPPAAAVRLNPAPAAAPASVASEATLAADWADDCRSELGILCHDVPEKGRIKCLKGYRSALLKACRDAVSAVIPSDAD